MRQIVMGIDPGSRFTGYGVIASEAGAQSYIASGVIKTGDGDLSSKLLIIYKSMNELISQFKPDVVAVETTFAAKNVQSAIKLSEARASAIVAAAVNDLPVYEYTPMQIKSALTGTGSALKQQVKYMVKMLLHLKGDPQTDASDALACAICHAHIFQVTSKMGGEVAKAPAVHGRLGRR